jgi:TonB family protein
MAYRVPRRFILPADDPPPYGFFALSLLGHGLFLFAMLVVSAYVGAQLDRSKVYIVNLVPAPPSPETASPRGAAQTAPRPAPERAVKPPEPAPPKKVEEREPPKPPKVQAPPPRETPPPRPERPPERAADRLPPPPPPRPTPATEVARAVPPRPEEFALPRRAEKEAPALETSVARERLRETPPLPPRPPAPVTVAPPPPPARPPEPPRAVAPPAATPAAPPVATAAARPGLDPVPLGRPGPGATSTGSLTLDVSDFPFTYYLRQIQSKISERWSPPRAAAAGGERAVVMFEIGRDGQIKEPKLERESGNAVYDQSALRAVVDASPFPPLPPEFKAPSLRIHFGFEFRPDQG